MNPDGSYNIKRIGGLGSFRDFYKFLIDVSWPRFLFIVTAFYLLINVFFTCLYLSVGTEQLVGKTIEESPVFGTFFFSVQTFTTVGYGSISPNGMGADIIVMVEAYFGLMSFALATGLLYARFSKPGLKIAFSKHIILTPFEGGKAFMFKMVNQRKNVLLNTSVKVMLILDKGGKVDSFNKQYFEIKLENDKVNFFPLTWTLVHKIDENSPFHGLTLQELMHKNAELVILVETFDETYGQALLQKHSYAHDQWKENVKFDTNFRPNDKGELELHVDEIDNLLPVE